MLLKDIHDKFQKDVLVPMTLLRPSSYGIIERLNREGIPTKLLILEASRETIRERILRRGEDPDCWCIQNIDPAMTGSAALPGIRIQTEGRTIDDLAAEALSHIAN